MTGFYPANQRNLNAVPKIGIMEAFAMSKRFKKTKTYDVIPAWTLIGW